MIDQNIYECPANKNHKLKGKARFQKHLKKCKEYNIFSEKSDSLVKEDSTEDRKKLSELLLRHQKEKSLLFQRNYGAPDENVPIKREKKREAKIRMSEETHNKTNFKCMLMAHPLQPEQNAPVPQPLFSSTKESSTQKHKSKNAASDSIKSAQKTFNGLKNDKKAVNTLANLVRSYLPRQKHKKTKCEKKEAQRKESPAKSQQSVEIVLSQADSLQSGKEVSIDLSSNSEEVKQKKNDGNLVATQSLSTVDSLSKCETCLICKQNERNVILGCGHAQMCRECFEGLFHFEAKEFQCVGCQKQRKR